MPKVSVLYMGYQQEYYQKNKAIIIAKVKQWAKDNPERAKKNQESRRKLYYATPKGIYIVMKRNTSKRAVKDIMVRDEFIKWYEAQEKTCYYCGRPQGEKRLEIDRKDNSKGYFLTNIALACSDCNGVKSNILTEAEMKLVGHLVMRRRWQR